MPYNNFITGRRASISFAQKGHINDEVLSKHTSNFGQSQLRTARPT
jgi:hypothetical protein